MIGTIGNRVREVLDRFEWGLSVLANVSLFVMVVAVTVDTILRYVFSSPLPGVHTIASIYLLPAFVFGTAAHLQNQKGNINVGILRKDFSNRGKRIVDTIGRIGALFVFAPMSLFTLTVGIDRFQRGSTLSGLVSLPTSYTWFVISLGLAMLSIRLLRQIIAGVNAIVNEEQADAVEPKSVLEEIDE